MVDGRAARWAGHRDRRRAELVEAAVRTVEQVGPGATVEQIAAEAGVSRQVLYRQFADRDDLERAVAEHAATLLVEHLTPRLALDAGVEEGVRAALRAYLDFVEEHLALYRFVRAHETDRAPGAVRRVKDSVTATVTGLARSLVDDAPGGLADTAAIALVGMADAVLAAWLEDPRGLPRPVLEEHLVALAVGLVSGARPRAGA